MVKVSDDGSVTAAPTFEYTHAGRDKNGTSRAHPRIDYDRPKADPIPHPPSAALRLASASLVRVIGGPSPEGLQILRTLHILLLKLLFLMQRQFSLQAVEEFVKYLSGCIDFHSAHSQLLIRLQFWCSMKCPVYSLSGNQPWTMCVCVLPMQDFSKSAPAVSVGWTKMDVCCHCHRILLFHSLPGQL